MERDKKVEHAILQILNDRWKDCLRFHGLHVDPNDPDDPCFQMRVRVFWTFFWPENVFLKYVVVSESAS